MGGGRDERREGGERKGERARERDGEGGGKEEGMGGRVEQFSSVQNTSLHNSKQPTNNYKNPMLILILYMYMYMMKRLRNICREPAATRD